MSEQAREAAYAKWESELWMDPSTPTPTVAEVWLAAWAACEASVREGTLDLSPLVPCGRPGCGVYFSPARKDQKYHDSNCRKLASKHRAAREGTD